jgi:hypothetical protein
MSDTTHEAPDRIWIWGWRADSVWQEQTWQHEDEPMSTMEYVRFDLMETAEQRGYANAMEAERKLHEDRIEALTKERGELKAQVEQFRNTNRRLNRRVQLLEGWWQRRLERAKYWRGLYLWGMRRKDLNVKAIEEAAYQRGYEDGFEEKFRMPKLWARQPRRINSGESHD